MYEQETSIIEVPCEANATIEQGEALSQLVPVGTRALNLSFGGTVVAANGTDREERKIVSSQSFITGPEPFALISNPDGDAYLNFLGAGASGPGEIVLALKLLPGFEGYYREIGLLHHTTTILELDPCLAEKAVPGFPWTSPLQLLASDPTAQKKLQELISDSGAYFVSTFPDSASAKIARALGMEPVQSSEPFVTNNKAELHQAFNEHCLMCPAVSLHSSADEYQAKLLALEVLIERLRNQEALPESYWSAAWLKLAHGSGGDFVKDIRVSRYAIEDLSRALGDLTIDSESIEETARIMALSTPTLQALREIEAGIYKAKSELFEAVCAGFSVNCYEITREEFWNSPDGYPHGSTLLCEKDAHYAGPTLENASNVMVVHRNGELAVPAFMRQITGPDGDYRGSTPFFPEETLAPDALRELFSLVHRVGEWCAKHSLFGYVGVDFFIVTKQNGEQVIRLTEVNGRIPISGTALIMAQKLQAPAWLNVNIEIPRTILEQHGCATGIETMEDFYRIFAERVYRPGLGFANPLIMPQAFRTVHNSEHMTASGRFKALIVGCSSAECIEFQRQLREEGFIL